jgi:hypothetical protein
LFLCEFEKIDKLNASTDVASFDSSNVASNCYVSKVLLPTALLPTVASNGVASFSVASSPAQTTRSLLLNLLNLNPSSPPYYGKEEQGYDNNDNHKMVTVMRRTAEQQVSIKYDTNSTSSEIQCKNIRYVDTDFCRAMHNAIVDQEASFSNRVNFGDCPDEDATSRVRRFV